MKKLFITIIITLLTTVSCFCQVSNRSNKSLYEVTNSSVRYWLGYLRSNGKYVSGHYKTNSNKSIKHSHLHSLLLPVVYFSITIYNGVVIHNINTPRLPTY